MVVVAVVVVRAIVNRRSSLWALLGPWGFPVVLLGLVGHSGVLLIFRKVV